MFLNDSEMADTDFFMSFIDVFYAVSCSNSRQGSVENGYYIF